MTQGPERKRGIDPARARIIASFSRTFLDTQPPRERYQRLLASGLPMAITIRTDCEGRPLEVAHNVTNTLASYFNFEVAEGFSAAVGRSEVFALPEQPPSQEGAAVSKRFQAKIALAERLASRLLCSSGERRDFLQEVIPSEMVDASDFSGDPFWVAYKVVNIAPSYGALEGLQEHLKRLEDTEKSQGD